MENLINELIKYLVQLNKNPTVLDIIITYVIPIVGTVIALATAVGAVVKYFQMKNRDFNEKILNEVYAPLYQYIIKQEFIRDKFDGYISVKRAPILQAKRSKTTTTLNFTDFKEEKEVVKEEGIFNVEEIVRIKNEVLNPGLIPNDTLILLNAFEMCLEIKTDKSNAVYYEICNALRENIIKRMREYQKKLGIYKKSRYLKKDMEGFYFFDNEQNEKNYKNNISQND